MKLSRPFRSTKPKIDNTVKEKVDIWAPVNHICSRAIASDESVQVVVHHWPETNIAGVLRILRKKEDATMQECFVQAIGPGQAYSLMPVQLGNLWVFPYWVSGTLSWKVSGDFANFSAEPELPDIAETAGLIACGADALIVDAGPPGGLWYFRLGHDVQWRCLPRPPVAGTVTSAIHFQDKLWLATDQGLAGFSLWSMPLESGNSPTAVDDWTLVLERGGWRYAVNRTVTALLPFKDQLLLATAATGTWLQRLGNHGPEILVLKPEGGWEIVVGQPRFTPAGIKIPLASLGPGFDDGRPARINALLVDGGVRALVCDLDPPASGSDLGDRTDPNYWYCHENLAQWERASNFNSR